MIGRVLALCVWVLVYGYGSVYLLTMSMDVYIYVMYCWLERAKHSMFMQDGFIEKSPLCGDFGRSYIQRGLCRNFHLRVSDSFWENKCIFFPVNVRMRKCWLTEDWVIRILRASHPPNRGRDRVVSGLRFFLFLLEQSVLGWDFSHHYESRHNFDWSTTRGLIGCCVFIHFMSFLFCEFRCLYLLD